MKITGSNQYVFDQFQEKLLPFAFDLSSSSNPHFYQHNAAPHVLAQMFCPKLGCDKRPTTAYVISRNNVSYI